MIHWTWILIFAVLNIVTFAAIYFDSKETGIFAFPWRTVATLIALIVLVLIYGGIFWW
jgi:hypothetical protein